MDLFWFCTRLFGGLLKPTCEGIQYLCEGIQYLTGGLRRLRARVSGDIILISLVWRGNECMFMTWRDTVLAFALRRAQAVSLSDGVVCGERPSRVNPVEESRESEEGGQ